MNVTPDDRKFMHACENAKRESHDPHRQVGSVIVGAGGNILAKGANSPPTALNLSREDSLRAINADRDWRYFVLEHAERNAIKAAGTTSLEGATIYSTLFPCADCARAIVASGIKRLVTSPTSGTNSDEKWATHFRYSRFIFEKAGICVDLIEP